MIPSNDISVENLKRMDDSECVRLCSQLREELVADVSKTGGHLASNLGAVELTVAIHRVFNTETDRLIFDVGHQCYCHKMLTGRIQMMNTLRQLNGLSGFPKPNESIHDAFIAGHASNSVSVALGMARARTLMNEDYHIIALIGDGALTGGLAYEGLSDAGESKEPLIVILNDNGMSIMKNVGGIANLLARQRMKPQYLRVKRWFRRVTNRGNVGKKIYRFVHRMKQIVKGSILPSSFFEELGFDYIGPVDGHDISQLTKALSFAKEKKVPTVVHVRTVKGKGYAPAETTPNQYHGVSKFNPADGKPLAPSKRDFSSYVGEALCEFAAKDPHICVITAAMVSGTGLSDFFERYPKQAFDVGIAEGHAVAMCGGLAKQGMIPVFAVYSTFLQRGYDMLIHDIALQQLHAVFCVDRAGLVGNDGETHQGVYDLAYLSSVPGMSIFAPASFSELRRDLNRAVYLETGPVAVRYPRGGENGFSADFADDDVSVIKCGGDISIVSYGTLIAEVLTAADLLENEGIQCEVIKLNRINPVNPDAVIKSVKKTNRLLVVEEVVEAGCIGKKLSSQVAEQGIALKHITLLNLKDHMVAQGSVAEQRALQKIDAEAIYHSAREDCLNG